MFNESDGIKSLFEDETNFVANASNFTSYVYHQIANLNWVGFYFFDGKELVLGPFQGKPACIRISLGKGVCGSAARSKKTIIVDDVHEFPGHIACDSASNSEIVIPIIIDEKLLGVLDIDSPALNRFSEDDKKLLEEYLQILIDSSDMLPVFEYYGKA